MNLIEEWSWETPNEEGMYLFCYGDVESPDNIALFEVIKVGETITARDKHGFLFNENLMEVNSYKGKSYKFAKIKFNQ